MYLSRGTLGRMAVSAAAGVALFLLASSYAYEQRGYVAAGGEYLLLLMPLWVELIREIKGGM